MLELADRCPRVLPAIGLHPWFVNSAPADWQQQFLRALDAGAQAIGEVGLDRWIEGFDLPAQLAAFRWQVAQASAPNLPLSIHCLKAMGLLLQTLPQLQLPAPGPSEWTARSASPTTSATTNKRSTQTYKASRCLSAGYNKASGNKRPSEV